MESIHLLSRRFVTALAALALVVSTGSAQAALMAYDGFADGGASPDTAAGEYETGTGYDSDFILDQAPTTTGFSADPWTNDGSTYASFVYYRAEGGQLAYSKFGKHLDTTDGQVQFFRSSGTSTDVKNIFRDLNIGNSLPDTLYISILVQKTAGTDLVVRSASTNGSEVRRFNFGLDENDHPFVTGTGTGSGQDTNLGVTAAVDTPHLLVAKLTNDGFDSDQIDLYLDPILVAEGFNTPVASVDGGNFYVGGNASWSLDDIYFRLLADAIGEALIVDEIRIGMTWADVTPYSIVPTPAALPMGLLGMFALGARRRRR